LKLREVNRQQLLSASPSEMKSAIQSAILMCARSNAVVWSAMAFEGQMITNKQSLEHLLYEYNATTS